MPDIPNPNVTIPLTIIFICVVISWITYRYARRERERIRAEREARRNRNRPADVRPPAYQVAPGSTQALPTVAAGGPAFSGMNISPSAPAPNYGAPPMPSGVASGYQMPPLTYEPPATATAFDSAPSFPTTGSWGPGPAADISEIAPALPPAGDYGGSSSYTAPRDYGGYSPSDTYVAPGDYGDSSSSPPAADSSVPYLPSVNELEDWNRRYASAVEEWILNHEEALDAVTVHHVPVDSLDRGVAARKVELSSHLDYAAHAHPSRQQGAELAEMLTAADGTLGAMRVQDFAGAEQNHSRYLSYRDIWLPRVQRALAP